MKRYGIYVRGKLLSVYKSVSYAKHKAELYDAKHSIKCSIKVIE